MKKNWFQQTLTWICIAIVGAASILALIKEVNIATAFFFLLWILGIYANVRYLYF